jgi:hypothetical protein
MEPCRCRDDRIVSDEQEFRFRTATAGNDMGCTFTVEATVEAKIAATTDATFRIETEPASFDASLSQIRAKTLVVEAGGLERRLELGPAPTADSSHSGQAEFEDTSHSASEHAYWVRIIQTDRHRAWSSPVYVTWPD